MERYNQATESRKEEYELESKLLEGGYIGDSLWVTRSDTRS